MGRRDFEIKGNYKTEHKNLCNKYKLMIRNSKTTFYRETIEKCKNYPRELVKFVNDLRVKNHDKKKKISHG